jgi:GT2 family glycosyltransferase
MTDNPIVSVVVPHYNNLEGLDSCLAALGRQTYPADQFEIIVGDNNSPQGEAVVSQVIGGRAQLTTIFEKGAAPTRNGAMALARGDILAFTDSDCLPEPEWLEKGIAALSEFDFAGGRMKVLVFDHLAITPVEAFELVFAFNNETYVKKKGFTVTANQFSPRHLFDKIGGFRTGVSEDQEWSLRARGAGYRIGYAPAAIVGHPARRNWAELKAKWQRVNREQFGIFMERRGGRWIWFARSCLLPVSILAHAPAIWRSSELRSARERWGALTILTCSRFWRLVDSMRLLIRR